MQLQCQTGRGCFTGQVPSYNLQNEAESVIICHQRLRSAFPQLDSGGQVDVVYTDFAKAFDTVPHQRLLLKIKTYNIDIDLLFWITDFLCNRKQCVVLNGEK